MWFQPRVRERGWGGGDGGDGGGGDGEAGKVVQQ